MSEQAAETAEVEALGEVIRNCIKQMTVLPLWPGGPGGMGASEYDIARAVLASGLVVPSEES